MEAGRKMNRSRITTSRRPLGFTLVEVLVSLVLLSIGAAGLIGFLNQVQQQNDRRRNAEIALRIGWNEVERVRGAGAWNVPSTGTLTRIDASGAPAPFGEFLVYVYRNVYCDPLSERTNDSGTVLQPCPGAFARITVRVDHLQAGAWRTRVLHVFEDSGNAPATGSWNLAGTP